ncbi:MAG: hypothetical protein FWC13_04715 [Oscillospiraceae bacterium]|nr:hypothetical protein [Oscillospiraceae bacterium]
MRLIKTKTMIIIALLTCVCLMGVYVFLGQLQSGVLPPPPTYSEVGPDGRILAMGICGTVGYIFLDDFREGTTWLGWTPESSVDFETWYSQIYEEMVRLGVSHIWTIPLYGEDGKTVIGEFAITP